MRALPRILALAFAFAGMIAIGVAHPAGMDAGVGTGVDSGLVITPSPLDFGIQQVNTSASKSLTLTNSDSILTITINSPLGKPNVPNCNAFTVTPSPGLPDPIPPMTTRTWNVMFTPPGSGFFDCQWTLSTDDGGNYSIHLTGQGVAGHVNVSPNPLDFGQQPVGTAVSQPFTLSNDGSGSISITAINQTTGNPPFSIPTKPILPLLLDPGDSVPITVKFKPTTTGSFMGTVQISDDGPSSTGTTVTLLGSGGGTGSGAIISMTPNPVDFGSIPVGASNGGDVTIGNTGAATLDVTALDITGSDATQFSFADASLGCTSGQSCNSPFSVLVAGVPRQVALSCAPTSPGLHFATLSASSNASGGNSSVTLQCTGAAPDITVSPPSISYGTVRVNTTAHANLHISNIGSAALNIAKIDVDGTNPGDFAPQSCAGGCTIGAGSGTDVDVTFTPPVRGVRGANLHVMSDDPTTPDLVVGLDGAGGLPVMVITQPANKMISFGGIPINTTSSTAPVTVQNQGELTLNISSATTSAPFAATGPTTVALGPSATATWQLTCHPLLAMPYNGTFKITGDDPANASDMVSLDCTGINSNITAVPNPLSFGEVRTDRMVTTPVVFTNTGLVAVTIDSAPIDAPFTDAVVGTLPRTLNQGDKLTVNVTFAPSADMHYTGNLNLGDGAGSTVATVAISGDGRRPGYMVAPLSIDFGSLCVAQADNQDITITNNGTAHISLVSTALTGGNGAFAITNGNVTSPIDFAPTAQHTVTIVGTAAQGPHTGNLVVTTDVTAAPTTSVSLSITGTQSGVVANPSSVAFGAHDVGVASSPTSVSVINCSSKALVVSSLAVTGADASAFMASGTQPITIPIGGNASWNVVFTAAHAGAHAAQLELANDGPSTPLVVTLSGTGNGSQTGGDGGVDGGNGESSTSYYACACHSSADPMAGAPIAIAFALVLRRRRRR